jgi:predicted RNase H-like nuclease (RuvC/YqgF family)
MDTLHLTAEEIKLKVIKLLRKMEQLESKCNALEAENLALKNSINEQKNSIKALEETNKMLKIAETLNLQDDKRELKKLVNGYIKEIDECLRLLSNK